MERVEDEVISVVGPPMTGDDLRATADHNLVHIIREPARPDVHRPLAPSSRWSGT